MEESWEPSGREPRTMFSWGPDHPPTECDCETHPPLNVILRGPRSKISAMGPEFLATALRAITVSGPSTVYHLVFTPYSPFLTVTRLKSVSPHGAGRFSIGSSQTRPCSPGHMMMPARSNIRPVFVIPEEFLQILANENIRYDVDENLWPNPQDMFHKNIEVQWGTL